MKTLLLALILCVSSTAFAQRHGGGGYRFTPRPFVVHSYNVGIGSYGWYGGYYDNLGFYYPYASAVVVAGSQGCKKETLKDSNNVKHQVLECRQADGSIKVISGNDLK